MSVIESINKYSRWTYWRKEQVSKEEINTLFELKDSWETRDVYEHIEERARQADDFFSHVRTFYTITKQNRGLLR